MKSVDEVIDEIILKSPYGAKCWEDRQKRKLEKTDSIVCDTSNDDVIVDHPNQLYICFEEDEK